MVTSSRTLKSLKHLSHEPLSTYMKNAANKPIPISPADMPVLLAPPDGRAEADPTAAALTDGATVVDGMTDDILEIDMAELLDGAALVDELAVMVAFIDMEDMIAVPFIEADMIDAETDADADGEGVMTLIAATPPPMVL